MPASRRACPGGFGAQQDVPQRNTAGTSPAARYSGMRRDEKFRPDSLAFRRRACYSQWHQRAVRAWQAPSH